MTDDGLSIYQAMAFLDIYAALIEKGKRKGTESDVEALRLAYDVLDAAQ